MGVILYIEGWLMGRGCCARGGGGGWLLKKQTESKTETEQLENNFTKSTACKCPAEDMWSLF